VLTSLGRRYARVYKSGGAVAATVTLATN
jgi:hypothetical protein